MTTGGTAHASLSASHTCPAGPPICLPHLPAHLPAPQRLHPACEVLQVALAIAILAVTAAELANQAGSYGAQAQCLIGASTAADLCTYVYLASAVPLIFSLLAATCVACCTCRRQPFRSICFGSYAAFAWVWWCVAAGVVTAAVARPLPPEFGRAQAARVALAALLWLQVAAHTLMAASSCTRGRCRCAWLGGCAGCAWASAGHAGSWSPPRHRTASTLLPNTAQLQPVPFPRRRCCEAGDIGNLKFKRQAGDSAPYRRDQPSPFWTTGRLTRQQQVVGGIVALQMPVVM